MSWDDVFWHVMNFLLPAWALALGITACLYAYSNLSFGDGSFGQKCGRHYHWLFEFAMQHPEAKEIRAAID